MKGFTKKEAAKLLGKSVRTLKRWKKSGKLVPIKKGDIEDRGGRGKGDIYDFDDLKRVTPAILDWFDVEKFPMNVRLDSIVSPNDKLTRNLFNLPADEYFDALQKGISITVTETTIRGKKIQTHFKLNGGGLAALRRPFNEYDRTIFDVCNSAREAKFIGITRDSLFRAVIGGKTNQYPRPNQANAILESLKRLMTVIEVDFSQARDKMPKYNSVKPILISPILPCRILHNVLVNGQLTSIIKFTDESPLMTIARAKKQIITYSVKLRDIAGQNNTTLVIIIKSYVIRRVLEIIAHNMTPTITFEDLFRHCELFNATRKQQQDARKIVISVMNNLQSKGVIKSFELIKNRVTMRF